MSVILVTGKVGSGKSTLLKMLKDKGLSTIEYDNYDSDSEVNLNNIYAGITKRITEPNFVEFPYISSMLDKLFSAIKIDHIIFVDSAKEIRYERVKHIYSEARFEEYENKQNENPYFFTKSQSVKIINDETRKKLYYELHKALMMFSFSDYERNEVFKRIYENESISVKQNVQCYMYRNSKGCINCPFPCPISDLFHKG